MEPNNTKINIDPDYQININALRKIEQKERDDSKLTSEKLSKIIVEEFNKELSIRQKQLEEVEEKICKAQKLLHLVRYVLVTSYYNKKSLDYNSIGEESITTAYLGAQNRIHPAVKKLLGSNASLEIFNSRGKRRANNKSSDNEAPTSHPFSAKKIKLEKREVLEDTSNCHLVENNQNSFNRKKTRHRIVIGNISKWMPSLENDNTTHKWMVYVRSLEETMDISCIIEKVVFYLHPSYKPHDVVEVSNCPFHLSRRGWGEFPIRVQVFFKCPLNKPVSIVHNLKLDKTYTGRQTLGNETVVDLYLHSDNFPLKEEAKEEMLESLKMDIKNISDGVLKKIDDVIFKEPLKKEIDEDPVCIKMESESLVGINQELANVALSDLTSSNSEHNYCHDEELAEERTTYFAPTSNHNFSLFDHSYSLPHEEYNDIPCDQYVNKNDFDVASQQPYNTLMYGLDDSYAESKTINNYDKDEEIISSSKDKSVITTFTTATGQPIRFLPQSFNNILRSNVNVIQIKLLNHPTSIQNKIDAVNRMQAKTTYENLINYEKYRLTLPRNYFKNLGEALPYLFKRLPLWNSSANDLDFKCTYPFVAESKTEFMSWNIGKRVNSEWNRAKSIKKILSVERFPYFEMWNTKTFFMYGRSHGYSPSGSCGTLLKKQSVELELLRSCFTDSLPQDRFFLSAEVDIDVTAQTDPDNESRLSLGKSHIVDISDNTLMSHCSFVKEAALDCGIILKPEEILEGVVMNAAERMLFEALRCFAECLIRRSSHHLQCRENYSEQFSEITVEEVKVALNERSELRSIMNFQKRKQEKEFFL